jgi:hypothetical protein
MIKPVMNDDYALLSEETKLSLRGACLKCPAAKTAAGRFCLEHRYTRAAKCSVLACGKLARKTKPGECYCAKHAILLDRPRRTNTGRPCKYCGRGNIKTKIIACAPCFRGKHVCGGCQVKPGEVRLGGKCIDCSGKMDCKNHALCNRRLCKGLNGLCRECAIRSGTFFCMICGKHRVMHGQKFCKGCSDRK